MIHLGLFSMFSSTMLSGNLVHLVLIHPPQILVLDSLYALDLRLRHGQLEISLQPVPLIRPLTQVLDHDQIIAPQKFHSVLPKIWEVEGLSFFDDLRYFDSDLVVLVPDNLEGIVWLCLDINDVAMG